MDIVDKELFKQFLGDIAFIGKEFTENLFVKYAVFQGFSVINICLCDTKFDDLTFWLLHHKCNCNLINLQITYQFSYVELTLFYFSKSIS